MENKKSNTSLEALKMNQLRPGLDANKSFINKPTEIKADLSPEQKKAESLLGKSLLAQAEVATQKFDVHQYVKHVDVESADYTVNYDMFKRLKVNRPVDKNHVNHLMGAIRTKNLLHLNPIVVNRDMEVIDGQHRLAAAKGLHVAIYCIVDDHISQDDIAGMNSVKKNWQLGDYINFYANKGAEEYVLFQALCKKYTEFPATTLLMICHKEGKRASKDVINGILDISNLENGDDVIAKIQFFIKHFHLANSTRFIEAVLFLLHSKEPYDHNRMVQKVELSPFMLVPCADKKGYIRILQSIYNKGVREENIVTFLKR